MQDLNALQGKSIAELREIAKALGIADVSVKKRELLEKIAVTAGGPNPDAVSAAPEVSDAPAVPALPERTRKGRRYR